jgi:hypothetical protein
MTKVPYWATRRDLVQQILELGVPTDVPRADLVLVASQSNICIKQISGIAETSVFDLDVGGTGYMASLSLTVLREPFAIAAFEIAFPWTRRPVIWLSDPAASNGPRNNYRFPGRDSPEYPRDVVINHRADAQRNLSRGRCIEGLLLGYGLDSIPDHFQHGGQVDGTLGGH